MPCYYRWQVRVCLWQRGHKFYQFSWVPSAARPLCCAACGEREAPGPVTWSPPQRRGRREGAGWSRLDWMGLGGEDRMSSLARSLPWKTGTVGRRSGTPGGGCWEFLPELLWVWNVLTHSWSLRPSSGLTGIFKTAAAATFAGTAHLAFLGQELDPQPLLPASPPQWLFLYCWA